MITYDELVKKHYILQIKRINPFKSDKPFHSFEGFGIECGEGWYGLLDDLCTKIESILDGNKEAKESFKIAQIKEKFGALRFYTYGACDEIYELIEEASDKSITICENCGKNGIRIYVGTWIHTACKDCGLRYLSDWRQSVLNGIVDSEKVIQLLKDKKNITEEEVKEFNEAREWLNRCEEDLITIEEQVKELYKIK